MVIETDDFVEYELTTAQAYDRVALRPPTRRKLGGKADDVALEGIRVRIGRRPIARNLRRLYELSNRAIPPDVEVFDAYEIWLLSNTFSILREGGAKSVRQVGFNVQLAENPRCTVLSVLPKTEFVKSLEIGFSNLVDVAVDGSLELPGSQLLPKEIRESVGTVDAKIAISSSARIVGTLSFSVITPVIQSIGGGDNESSWLFERREKPLVGDQQVFQIILTPRRIKSLKFTAGIFVNVSTWGFVLTRLVAKDVELSVSLD